LKYSIVDIIRYSVGGWLRGRLVDTADADAISYTNSDIAIFTP
jgi:hypothetical protein